MPDPSVRIRCTQLSPRIGEPDRNLAAIERELVDAASDGIDLLVLPELATSGYALTGAEAREVAVDADGAVLDRWRELVAGSGTAAVVGFCERVSDEVCNSAAILVPGADPVVYRKLHLWGTETALFTPGDARPPIVQTPFGRLGVLICYDLEFPELPRALALRGADVLAVPANWPSRERPTGERPHEVIHAMAAAQASAVAIACCDRAGDERGTSWTEGTAVVGTDGWPVGAVGAAGRLDATVALPVGRRRVSAQNDLFADRRDAFYGVAE